MTSTREVCSSLSAVHLLKIQEGLNISVCHVAATQAADCLILLALILFGVRGRMLGLSRTPPSKAVLPSLPVVVPTTLTFLTAWHVTMAAPLVEGGRVSGAWCHASHLRWCAQTGLLDSRWARHVGDLPCRRTGRSVLRDGDSAV